LVVKRSELAGDFVTGGQDTVGVRVPNHPVALGLLEAFAKAGVKYQSLTNYSNLISLAVEKNIVSAATESLLMDWRKDPANWQGV
jgi:predicted transcriptional regulator with HTH domain